jgi:hypothetical protein
MTERDASVQLDVFGGESRPEPEPPAYMKRDASVPQGTQSRLFEPQMEGQMTFDEAPESGTAPRRDAGPVQLPRMRLVRMRTDRNVRTNGGTLELWASQEVCSSLGWSREHLRRARDTQGFPEPVAVVAGGQIAVWDASAVRAWWEEQDPTRAREWRRAEAVRMYRRGKRIADISRALNAKPDSIRKWLRNAGEQTPRDASAG